MARRHTSVAASGATILVVDDQEEILVASKYLLEREGHQVLTAMSGHDGLALVGAVPIHLIILDYFMPRMTGEQCIREIRKVDEDVQILLQTGYSGERPPREMCRALTIQGYHDKSEGPDRLLLWVDVALKAATQLKRVRDAEHAMAEAHAQLRRLSARLLDLQEKERVRISRELHDHLGQLLTAVGMNLDWVLHHSTDYTSPIRERLRETRQLIQDVTLATRELSATLRPGELRGLGLQAALQAYLSDFERRSGLPVSFSYQLVDKEIPSEMATTIYRIVQEALTNVARYAEASEVNVTLEQSSSRCVLFIRDDGKGFNVQQVTDPHAVGLIGIHERARLLGGTVAIHSSPGAGTLVQADIPLPQDSTTQ